MTDKGDYLLPEWADDERPWHCGVCGQDGEDCSCGEPLMLIVRVPGVLAAEVDHDAIAAELVAMLNEQRIENYGGPEGYGPAPIRLLASGWATPDSGKEAQVDNHDALVLYAALLERGLGAHEARATVWPDDPAGNGSYLPPKEKA